MTDRAPMPNAVSKTSTGATVTNVAEGRDPRALRAEPIPPQQLTPEQQPYYQLSKRQIEEQFSGASVIDRLNLAYTTGALQKDR